MKTLITINYCKSGQAYSDFDAEAQLKLWLRSETDFTYHVSTENVIAYARLYVAEGLTDISKVKLQFNGNDLEMNEYAVISNWQKGFCDYGEEVAARTIRAQNKKSREKKHNKKLILLGEMTVLTLLRGKARKSEYMQIMHKGTNNSVMVLYGHDIPVLMPEGKEAIVYDRSEKSKSDLLELEADLMELMAQILGHTEHKYVYLYGNFEVNEVETLIKITEKVYPKLSIIATVQDDTVPNGQIVIEEIR